MSDQLSFDGEDLKKVSKNEVTLLGLKIGVKSDSDPEIVRDAVRLAELKILDAEKRVKGKTPHHIAVLALLDLAEEYIRAKKKVSEHRDQLNEKTAELLTWVEKEI
ncbi:MAG: hypothetical protein CL678_08870 [Bdellovibrionaceae bacterium]|nr:hypothetical protein [Pseudobdellovibrionaceae bacterium]|tara:strand:+ start:55 stop:372 length:318 start_codon:yes stop_codon:yes gene_type:complete